MKTSILTSVALAACVGTQVFATGSNVQNTKEDVITFALTTQGQDSVSTSSSVKNAGLWSQGPKYYKTVSKKLTQVDIIKAIGAVVHGNANYYSSKAKLVLVQGELSGFFNISPDLTESIANPLDTNAVTGFDGSYTTHDRDVVTSIGKGADSSYLRLDTGTHFIPNPVLEAAALALGSTNPAVAGWPIGHMQPWGQIFVKDPDRVVQCENVTFFFAMTVEECYDCFYMNSFISDATFTTKTTTGQSGPPCCTVASSTQIFGSGKDRYYLTLSFDNSINNPYLNYTTSAYVGYDGLNDSEVDGITPDSFGTFSDIINFRRTVLEPNKIRFALNGIVNYNWSLKMVNTTDIAPDFVGSAKYDANGYGFIGLVCTLLTGSANFSEKVVSVDGCCLNAPWYGSAISSWYGVGYDNYYYGTDPGYYYSESPLNPAVALSYHTMFNEEYEPYEQY